ncbi:hypothetical protein yberc0001_810 [Yersinia bercovieri ATCC 43970]|uniref:Uncharacterized protein n=1 Tax=Yersinia bercovieri ATCC 43970 TaxID=349968 RepID=A0ABP2E6K5_YERBE|nr:hypothetical protein yberc0001_810 [Yersinia bercovieri ATCC 43970]
MLSTHPIIGSGRNQIAAPKIKLAMAVRGSKNYYFINQIQRHHWRKQAELVGLGAVLADLAESILTGLHRQCDKIAAMP